MANKFKILNLLIFPLINGGQAVREDSRTAFIAFDMGGSVDESLMGLLIMEERLRLFQRHRKASISHDDDNECSRGLHTKGLE